MRLCISKANFVVGWLFCLFIQVQYFFKLLLGLLYLKLVENIHVDFIFFSPLLLFWALAPKRTSALKGAIPSHLIIYGCSIVPSVGLYVHTLFPLFCFMGGRAGRMNIHM
jgi:hypothetical protein